MYIYTNSYSVRVCSECIFHELSVLYQAGLIFAQGRAMLGTKIKGGSGASTNYVIRCAKNPKGGGGGDKSTPWHPPE